MTQDPWTPAHAEIRADSAALRQLLAVRCGAAVAILARQLTCQPAEIDARRPRKGSIPMARKQPAGGKIGYITAAAPNCAEPRYPGQNYHALVPDTLDLQDRAVLAINGITGPTDPEADH